MEPFTDYKNAFLLKADDGDIAIIMNKDTWKDFFSNNIISKIQSNPTEKYNTDIRTDINQLHFN